jgi:putative transposase
MCSILGVSRSLVYYHLNEDPSILYNEEAIITSHIKDIFRRSRNNYGTRKIKVELENKVIRFLEEGYLEL